MTITYRNFDTSNFQQYQPFSHERYGCVDLSNNTSSAALQFRVDTSKAAPVNVDIVGGIPGADLIPFAPLKFLTGPTRAATVGKDVVVNATASERARLTIEESADGTTWTAAPGPHESTAEAFPLVAGVVIGLRFVPSLAKYRVVVTAGSGDSVKQVHVTSQVRDIGA